jgi:hypothetical protein
MEAISLAPRLRLPKTGNDATVEEFATALGSNTQLKELK